MQRMLLKEVPAPMVSITIETTADSRNRDVRTLLFWADKCLR